MPPDDRLLPRARHPFDLSEPVGPRAPNRRDDVIKVETLLGNAGSDILDRTGGPTGWYGAAFDRALRDWQKSNDLKADGIANPGGPTVRAAQAKAPALAATRPATPDEVEAHHAARAAGRPGPLAGRPQPPLPPAADPARVDAADVSANERTLRALGQTSDWSGLAEHAARSIDPDDPKTTAVARDLVDRISQDFGPDKAGAFMKHAVGYLTPDQYEALVDGSPNPGPPVGTPVATLMTETVAYQPNPSSGGTSGGQLGSLNQAATPMKVSAGSVQAPAPAGTASQRPPRQIDPAWTDRQKQTHETLWFLADRGKTQGRPVASNLLRQYLEGSGAPITLEADFVRKHPPTQEAMRRAERHFEEWLRGERGDKTFGEIRDWIQNNKPTQTIKAMKWDGQAYPGFDLSGSDQSLSLGQYTIQGIGDLTLTQKGDKVVVRGRIGHRLNDKYDFQEGKQGKKAGFLSNLATVPVGLANHDIGLTRNAIIDYERVAGAKGFPLRSKPWYRELVGVLTIKNGKVVKSHFQWRSVK